MVNVKHGARAVFRPQGYCPKPWIAQVNGQTLFDARGGQKRFGSEATALKAARQALSKAEASLCGEG